MEDTIRTYILESFLTNGRAETLANDEDLLTILDSLQILRMLMDLERTYSIKVENSELTPENLGTIARLAAFISQKRQESLC